MYLKREAKESTSGLEAVGGSAGLEERLPVQLVSAAPGDSSQQDSSPRSTGIGPAFLLHFVTLPQIP